MHSILRTLLTDDIEHDFQGFTLNYQPIFKIKGGIRKLYGCEALLRWKNAAYSGDTSPDVIIPILEDSGLINYMGRYIIDCGFKQCSLWRKIIPNFVMSINVSASQLTYEFIDYIIISLSTHNLGSNSITIELTETTYLNHVLINELFSILREHGINVALDDFGTGYASVDIFRLINVDMLKIDRSFVKEITLNVTDQIVVKSILDMCDKLKIDVCIEGIENIEMESTLSSLGMFFCQGYLYSKPISTDEFTQQFINRYNEQSHKINNEIINQNRYFRSLSSIDILDKLFVGVVQVKMDERFTIIASNLGFSKMLGYSGNQLLEKYNNEGLKLIHPHDINWILSELERQFNDGNNATLEYRLLNCNSEYVWVLGAGNIVEHSDGAKSIIFMTANINNHTSSRRNRICNRAPKRSKYTD